MCIFICNAIRLCGLRFAVCYKFQRCPVVWPKLASNLERCRARVSYTEYILYNINDICDLFLILSVFVVRAKNASMLQSRGRFVWGSDAKSINGHMRLYIFQQYFIWHQRVWNGFCKLNIFRYMTERESGGCPNNSLTTCIVSHRC